MHGRLRLVQRGGIDTPPLAHAWDTATPVELVGREYDQARLHHPSGVVLLERGNTISTALIAAYEELEQPTNPAPHQEE